MTGTQALLISGQISLPVSVSTVAAAAGIKVIDYAAFRAQFENSLAAWSATRDSACLPMAEWSQC